MTPSNYQRTRWLTLIGTIITQFALGRFIPGVCLTVRFLPSWGSCKPGCFLFRLVKSGAGNFVFCCGQIAGTFWC